MVYVPFYGYFLKWDLFALSDLLLSLAVFLPFGYILCTLFQGPAGSRGRAYFVSTIVGGALALLTEAFQIFLPGRYVDLTDVTAAGSRALGVLVAIRRKITSDGGAMVLYGIRPLLRKVFEVTKMTEIFPIGDDRAGAEELLRGL